MAKIKPNIPWLVFDYFGSVFTLLILIFIQFIDCTPGSRKLFCQFEYFSLKRDKNGKHNQVVFELGDVHVLVKMSNGYELLD